MLEAESNTFIQLTALAPFFSGHAASDCSLFGGEEKSNSRQDPHLFVGIFALHCDVKLGDKVGCTTGSGEVNGANVHADSWSFSSTNSSDMNNGHHRREFLEYHITKVALLTVATKFPASTFKTQTINV